LEAFPSGGGVKVESEGRGEWRRREVDVLVDVGWLAGWWRKERTRQVSLRVGEKT
jgi:hypothetical protein